MAADLANYYNQYLGGYTGPTYSAPAAPGPGLGGGGSHRSIPNLDFIGNALGIGPQLFGGGPHRPTPLGGHEYHQGLATLNAYNWLLPYTAQTVALGSNIFGDIYRQEASKSKAYELAQFGEYAPRYAQAILNADPRQAAMLEAYNNQLLGNTQQAQSYVNRLGGQLDNPMSSATIRDIMQASLGSAGARGFGPNARDAAMAYVQTGLVGTQLQQERENMYQQALGSLGSATGAMAGGIQANKAVLGDPFLAFAGRPGQPQGSNPMSPDYAGFNNDLFSYGVNQDIMQKNMSAANQASTKALIGQILGGLLGGAGGMAKGMI